MRENEPVLLVLSTYDGKLFLRKVKFYRVLHTFGDTCLITYGSLIFTGDLKNPHTVSYKWWV